LSTTRRLIRRRRARRAHPKTGIRRALRWLFIAALSFLGLNLLGALAGVGTVVSVYAFYAQQLPEPGAITRVEQEFANSRLYDRTGEHLLYEVIDPLGGDRIWAELPDIPLRLQQATIAIEDKTFYENPGYDLEGILRALWSNLTSEGVQGGSSITQQLVKNVLIEPEERTEVTLERKIKELILAIRISEEYSKDQILEWYLNTNFYGNLAYGVEAGAQVYFGKSVGELTLAESAMLAAIPQSPGLNPIDNFDLAKERQRVVLDAMVQAGYISQEEADIAFETPLEIRPPEQRFNLLAPHFSIAARKQVEDIVGADRMYREGGLVIYTTLDYDLFLQVECAARSHIARLSGEDPNTVIPASDGSDCLAAQNLTPLQPEERGVDRQVGNASAVVINALTGEVLAMLGSLDYYNEAIDGNFNVALATRQPGSAIKPFTYITAFEQGYTPATMTLDVRTAFDQGSNQPYVPENFDRQFHGPQSIRSALANSYNVPAVQVLDWVGIDNVIRIAHAMGINTLDRGLDYYGLSLTLGGGEVTLYDMTYAYATLANLGQMRGRPTPQELRRPGFRTLDPTLILRIEDREGNILWEYGQGNTFRSNNILEPSLAYLITDILSDDVARRPSVGAESALQLSRVSAVKTGTTNDYRDNWTVGYTPQIVTGVWVGNTDNSQMVDLPAIDGTAPIWHAIMEYAHRDLPVQTWERPPDIVEMTVCETSGLLPTAYCPTRQEIFRQGTEPVTYDTVYQPFSINKESGLLATVYTPAELVEEQVFMVLPPEAADWVREAGIPQPPTEYDTLLAPEAYGDVAITDPAPFSLVRGAITIHGNARDPNFQYYRLDYGEGLNPDSWTQIGQNSYTPRYNDELGIWDTRPLDGLYSLRLAIVQGNNALNEFIIQVTVDNIPPSIELGYPQEGQLYSFSDEFVTMQPFVSDNISMDRVEFYVDEQLIATSTVAPFNERWIITEAGTHVIQLRAYDTAGNTAASERVTIEVLPE
jgi:membrane peptidoglycan carboxypeptidase